MGAVTALRPTPQGMIGNPAWLAAGAAGFASAMLALWAFRGLPLGTLVLWFAAAPIFPRLRLLKASLALMATNCSTLGSR